MKHYTFSFLFISTSLFSFGQVPNSPFNKTVQEQNRRMIQGNSPQYPNQQQYQSNQQRSRQQVNTLLKEIEADEKKTHPNHYTHV